ncbi:MAG: DUF2807 domain-containing protein [Ignavibacteria bacterium]|nr:DUF2807 domain-containing protein [Ignavibacteria bacterium]
MKNIITLSLIVFTFLFYGSAYTQSVKGNGNIIKKDIPVSGMNKISSLGSFNVFIKQSDAEKLNVEGDENLMEYFLAEVSGGELSLSFSKNNVSPTKFNVYVEVKNLNKLDAVGSGNVKSENTIKSDKFYLEMVGSGNLDFNISSTDLIIDVTGSGDAKIIASATNCKTEHTGSGNMDLTYDNSQGNIKLEHAGSGNMTANLKSQNAILDNSGSGDFSVEGFTSNLKLENSGSGKFRGEKYAADYLRVELNGSGDASLICNKEAGIEINGSGDLYLGGNYTVKRIENNGSGKLKK